jgi:hypothetical protein
MLHLYLTVKHRPTDSSLTSIPTLHYHGRMTRSKQPNPVPTNDHFPSGCPLPHRLPLQAGSPFQAMLHDRLHCLLHSHATPPYSISTRPSSPKQRPTQACFGPFRGAGAPVSIFVWGWRFSSRAPQMPSQKPDATHFIVDSV